jgi:putative ABC transport system substrate-binding protein
MNRRGLLIAAGLTSASLLRAQTTRPAKDVVLLAFSTEQRARPVLDRLREELRKYGWADGANVRLSALYADGLASRVPENARSAVASNASVIVVTSAEAARTLKSLPHSVPVVFWGVPDPVKYGLVETLARPGGNFTGISSIALDVAPKLMQFARALAPGAKRIGGLINPANQSIGLALKDVEEAATAMGFEYRRFDIQEAAQIEPAFRAIVRANTQVLHVAFDPMLGEHYAEIAQLAIGNRLPSVSLAPNWAELGGLLNYGADLRRAQADVARYVDRILRGARPAELPVEQATTLPMTINLRTARALGISVPQSLLLSADRVIG